MQMGYTTALRISIVQASERGGKCTRGFVLGADLTVLLLSFYSPQGDKEAELGLPFSPLCDRKSTMVPQSQVGKIIFAKRRSIVSR